MGLRMNSVGTFTLEACGPISDISGFALQMLGKLLNIFEAQFPYL